MERSSSEGFTTDPPSLGYVPEARWRDRSTVIEGRNRLAFTDEVQLDSVVTYNRYEISPLSRYVFPASPTNWFFDDYKYGIGDTIGLEETVHATLLPTLQLLAGGSVAFSDIIPKSTVPGGADTDGNVVSQGGSFVYIDGTGATNTIQRVEQQKYETYAAYAELAWQAADKLKLIGGARLTYDTRPDTLQLIRGSLKAGYSFNQSLGMIIEETKPPISDEFRRILNEVRMGMPENEALSNSSNRIGSEHFA